MAGRSSGGRAGCSTEATRRGSYSGLRWTTPDADSPPLTTPPKFTSVGPSVYRLSAASVPSPLTNHRAPFVISHSNVSWRRRSGGRRRLALALAAVAVAAIAVPGQASEPSSWTPRGATYEVVVTKDVAITMSDGTVLSANIFRPARADGSPADG